MWGSTAMASYNAKQDQHWANKSNWSLSTDLMVYENCQQDKDSYEWSCASRSILNAKGNNYL